MPRRSVWRRSATQRGSGDGDMQVHAHVGRGSPPVPRRPPRLGGRPARPRRGAHGGGPVAGPRVGWAGQVSSPGGCASSRVSAHAASRAQKSPTKTLSVRSPRPSATPSHFDAEKPAGVASFWINSSTRPSNAISYSPCSRKWRTSVSPSDGSASEHASTHPRTSAAGSKGTYGFGVTLMG